MFADKVAKDMPFTEPNSLISTYGPLSSLSLLLLFPYFVS